MLTESESHAKSKSADHGQSIFQSEELRYGPALGAAHQLALRASGIEEGGKYARELTKF